MPTTTSEVKRRLDATLESAKQKKNKTINNKVLENMVDVKIENDEYSAAKRRKKSIRSADSTDDLTIKAEPDSSQRITLPQKKRAIQSPSRSSPVCKSTKLEDDEILIRETEAALKSLSGSYSGAREEDKFEQPQFENLFEEKKTVLSKPPPVTNHPASNVDLKDVITFRETNGKKCEKKFKKEDRNGDKFTPRYEPDFNELVDDSSNEVEMGMDEGKREKKLNISQPGFRGRTNIDNPTIPPIGPFPAAATFVGYPPNGEPVPPKPEPEKPVEPVDGKQYTILQPAGAGSRAATVMEDIAREGVLSVPAVTSSGTTEETSPAPSTTPVPVVAPPTPAPLPPTSVPTPTPVPEEKPIVPDVIRPLGSLSPASLSRGGKFAFCIPLKLNSRCQ